VRNRFHDSSYGRKGEGRGGPWKAAILFIFYRESEGEKRKQQKKGGEKGERRELGLQSGEREECPTATFLRKGGEEKGSDAALHGPRGREGGRKKRRRSKI